MEFVDSTEVGVFIRRSDCEDRLVSIGVIKMMNGLREGDK